MHRASQMVAVTFIAVDRASLTFGPVVAPVRWLDSVFQAPHLIRLGSAPLELPGTNAQNRHGGPSSRHFIFSLGVEDILRRTP
jgi:hypothetical protein